MNFQGWLLPAEGANRPASMIRATSWESTCFFLKSRLLRRW
jgi:hypothetical protein